MYISRFDVIYDAKGMRLQCIISTYCLPSPSRMLAYMFYNFIW